MLLPPKPSTESNFAKFTRDIIDTKYNFFKMQYLFPPLAEFDIYDFFLIKTASLTLLGPPNLLFLSIYKMLAFLQDLS
jgi:hypothetical protein